MPSLATWKKGSSGSSTSMRRTAESRGFGREVSPFHFVTWVHLCLVGCWLAVVGFVGVGFCCVGCHPGFLHGICLEPIGLLLSLDHRRLDDRQSLGARTA